MRGFVLSVLAFSAAFAVADGIKCFVCQGTESDCTKDKLDADKAKYVQTCYGNMDRCIGIWAKRNVDGKTVVANSCANKALCDTYKKTCDGGFKDGECAASCCDTDECNAGPPKPTDGLIKCFVCHGTESDCTKEKLEADKAKYLQTCYGNMDRCLEAWAKSNGTTLVANKCASRALCDRAKNTCDKFLEDEDGECGVSCCETDECNAGSPRFPTDGLKCYNCLGTEDACAKDKLERDKANYVTTCPSPLDRCMMYRSIRDSQAVVMRSCADQRMCDFTNQTCYTNNTVGHCAVRCCDTNECNLDSSAVVLSFSVFLMIFCFVLGLA